MVFETIIISILSIIGGFYAYNIKKAENEEKNDIIIVESDFRHVKREAVYNKKANERFISDDYEEVPLYDNIELEQIPLNTVL